HLVLFLLAVEIPVRIWLGRPQHRPGDLDAARTHRRAEPLGSRPRLAHAGRPRAGARPAHLRRRSGRPHPAPRHGRQLQARTRRLRVVERQRHNAQDRLAMDAKTNGGTGTHVNGSPPYAWPADALTRVPFWVYQSPELYAHEQQRIYEGPIWNYL